MNIYTVYIYIIVYICIIHSMVCRFSEKNAALQYGSLVYGTAGTLVALRVAAMFMVSVCPKNG